MLTKQNNYAFIDSQNLNLAIRSQGWVLDLRKFRIHLKETYGVEKAFAFVGFMAGNQALYTFLQDAGYIVIFKPTMEFEKDGELAVKGNVDAELVLQTMIEYLNYEKAVIITGDGDFYCLVKYLSENNKLLRLLIPNLNRYSKLLKSVAVNKLDFMNNLKWKLAYKSKGSQLRKD